MKMRITKEKLAKYAEMYDERYRTRSRETEEKIKSLLQRQRYLGRADFIRVGRWKSPRATRHYRENSDFKVRERTRLAFTSEDERQRVESLLRSNGGLKGVGYPVASTLLHFAFPDAYPIMDFRVIEALWGRGRPSSYTFAFWCKYCVAIRRIAREHKLPMRTVDKALWMYSKKNPKKARCAKSSE